MYSTFFNQALCPCSKRLTGFLRLRMSQSAADLSSEHDTKPQLLTNLQTVCSYNDKLEQAYNEQDSSFKFLQCAESSSIVRGEK